jgi:hypothetical protein
MDEADEVLSRAFGYPYEAPRRSFALVGGRTADPGSVDLGPAPRKPLLAYGSNASPAVLERKLGGAGEPLLAERASLSGFDVVYSAHISPYGAVPATLFTSPGTEVDVFVLRLTSAQYGAIEATELNYELSEVNGLPAYLSRHGCLQLDGSPVALRAIGARDRRLPELGQRQVLERVRAILAPEESLERFIRDSAADPALARRRSEMLRPS